jgi:hypothetical protein
MQFWMVWPSTLMVVSLERASRFLAPLGLKPAEVARCYPALRHFVREWEIWSHLNDNNDNDRDADEVTSHLAHELTSLFSRVSAAAGEGALLSLRHLLDLSIAFDRPPLWRDAWRSLLYYRLARSWTPEKLADVYAFSAEGLAKLFSLVTDFAIRHKAIDTEIEKAEAEPLRDWDAEAYKFYRREDEESSPLLGLMFFLQEILFDEIWWTVVDALTPAELDELQRWGEVELVTHMRIIPSDQAQLPLSARQRPVTP